MSQSVNYLYCYEEAWQLLTREGTVGCQKYGVQRWVMPYLYTGDFYRCRWNVLLNCLIFLKNSVSTKKDIEIKRSLIPKRFRLLKTSSEEICQYGTVKELLKYGLFLKKNMGHLCAIPSTYIYMQYIYERFKH